MKKSYSKLLILVMALVMSMSMAASVFAEGEEMLETKAITVSVLNAEGQPSGMYGIDSAVITKQEDGTYLAKLILTNNNRNLLALGDTKAAGIHALDWYKGTDVDGHMNFVIPVKKLDTDMTVSFSDTSRVAQGKAWSNNQTMKFDSSSMKDTEAPAVTLDESSIDKAIGEALTITNNLDMFKAVSAKYVNYKDKEYVVFALSGTGYRALFKGNDEEAIANGDKTENWIHGYLNADEKWEFVVPLDEGEAYYPIVSISNKYYNDYLKGKCKFEKAVYPRQIAIDTTAKTMVVDDYKPGSRFDDMTEEEVLAYVAENKSVSLLNELIRSIQVQYRDENTDKLCKAAKACWDALPDEDKGNEEDGFVDDGYFSDNTGDASADDPLNQDEIGENELLVVSFGTSFNDSRAKDIGGIEKALAKAYPGWSVRRAFTAQIIINHVQARDGEKIDNMEQALDRAVANGVKELVVQPTHLMHGAEYDELKEAVDAYADKFDSVVIAEPLLGQVGDEAATVNADKEAAAKAAVAEAVKVGKFDSLDAAVESKTAFVFMGHGTSHDAAITYDQMQAQMKELGYNNVFIGTVEGNPADTALPEVKKAVEAAGYEHVILRPLMVVAGDHANNDMAADEEGTWYYGFVNGGKFIVEGSDEAVDIGKEFGADNVKCQIEGLGRIPAIQKMYVAHTLDAINEIEPITKINSKVLELVQNQELIDAYLKASAFVDEYKPLVDAIVKNLDNGDTSDIEAYGRQLDELIKEMYDYAADYAAELEEDPEIKAAIDEVIAKAEELNDLLKEYGIDLSDGISEEEKAIIEEKMEEAKADLDKAIADLMDALNEEVLKEALDEFIAQAKDWAKDAAKEAGLTDEEIEEFMKQIEDLAAIVEEYAGMEPSEALDKLIEDAKALIEENADELKELAQQAINDAYEAFQNGDYDEYIAKTGLDPETVKAAVDDLVAYAMGAAAGDTYTALQDKVAALTEQLEKAQADAAAAQDALDQLKKDAEAQKASAEEKDAVIKQFINGYNVTKKKPTMKKAKAAKKKKVKVTFKGLKGAEATSYQISYKTGKKTKKKTVKKATTSAKKLNYTLKKLKKGKKYTVKVRAIYQFKYNGKTYKFMSKWSKGKKVKVK